MTIKTGSKDYKNRVTFSTMVCFQVCSIIAKFTLALNIREKCEHIVILCNFIFTVELEWTSSMRFI